MPGVSSSQLHQRPEKTGTTEKGPNDRPGRGTPSSWNGAHPKPSKEAERDKPVHRSTSNSACRAELGRFPLHLTVLKRALSFRAHLHRSNPSSHHHKALIHEGETEKPEPPEQPSQTQPEQNTNHNNLTKAGIRKMADEGQERYVSDWKNDINSSQKLTMYRSLQRDYRLAPYLEKLPDPRDRKILSRYRLSAHSLAIECGRHRQSYKPREERLCQHCDQEAIEDETHFLLHCSKYSAVRDTHFRRLSHLFPDFITMKEEEKTYILLGEEERAVEIALD
ncbi:uncharacterized protein [Ranitomeya imitator]|uniref:uncharacterized protein n=1 Tax=Ranitomeya imitator TaxID=111125 RepID=UPI0037E7AE18